MKMTTFNATLREIEGVKMFGNYNIIFKNNKIKFDFTLKHKLTIIKDESATGKSLLIKMIDIYNAESNKRGIYKLIIKRNENREHIIVANLSANVFWKQAIEQNKDNTIFFIDENASFIYKKEFAEVFKRSNCYFVIISRQNIRLTQISYHVNAIQKFYKFKENVIKIKPILQTQNNIFSFNSITTFNNIDLREFKIILTEDSTTGYKFFNKIFNGKVEKGEGKDNLINLVDKYKNQIIILIVDACAFGEVIENFILKSKTSGNYIFYFYESFEWILLNSIYFKRVELDREKIDFSEYENEEKYWEKQLILKCKDISFNEIYSKNRNKIPSIILSPDNCKYLINKLYPELQGAILNKNEDSTNHFN